MTPLLTKLMLTRTNDTFDRVVHVNNSVLIVCGENKNHNKIAVVVISLCLSNDGLTDLKCYLPIGYLATQPLATSVTTKHIITNNSHLQCWNLCFVFLYGFIYRYKFAFHTLRMLSLSGTILSYPKGNITFIVAFQYFLFLSLASL